MAYEINKTNVTLPTILVQDGEVNFIDTSIGLIGKNYPGYGEIIAEDLVWIMEHFASKDEPSNIINGQVWYNTSTELIYFCVNSSASTLAERWKVLDSGFTSSQYRAISIEENTGAKHSALGRYVNGLLMMVISSDSFYVTAKNEYNTKLGINELSFVDIGPGANLSKAKNYRYHPFTGKISVTPDAWTWEASAGVSPLTVTPSAWTWQVIEGEGLLRVAPSAWTWEVLSNTTAV